MKPDNYKNLIVWQKSMDLCVEIYQMIKDFPKYEQFALCDQLRRCSVSVPSNIAEGFSRSSKKETLKFLSVSRGSIGEVETQVILSNRLGYIDGSRSDDLLYKINGINVMLISLMNKLRDSLNDLTT